VCSAVPCLSPPPLGSSVSAALWSLKTELVAHTVSGAHVDQSWCSVLGIMLSPWLDTVQQIQFCLRPTTQLHSREGLQSRKTGVQDSILVIPPHVVPAGAAL
jgi:hypothetical protein